MPADRNKKGRPSRAAVPVIVVKRQYFDQIASGQKTVEYRRHGRIFNERVFYPGRAIRIAWSYNIYRHPFLDAIVILFETKPFSEVCEQLQIYRDLSPDTPMALIHFQVVER